MEVMGANVRLQQSEVDKKKKVTTFKVCYFLSFFLSVEELL